MAQQIAQDDLDQGKQAKGDILLAVATQIELDSIIAPNAAPQKKKLPGENLAAFGRLDW